MIDILNVGDMQERLASLVELSDRKRQTAEVYRQRRYILQVANTIFTTQFLDPKLTKIIRQKRLGRKRVSALVIDHDIVARGILTLALRDSCDVLQSKDAKSGIIAYIDKAPNIVFLEFRLPDYKGHDVLKRLKLLDPEAYVVILSGACVPENVLSAKALGVAGFFRKPFCRESILRHVKAVSV